MLKGYNAYSVQANIKGEERIMLTGRSAPEKGFGSRALSTVSSMAGPAISSSNSPTGYGLTGGALATPQLYDTLSGFLPNEDQNGQLYRKLYKDIYNYDTICGAAVDLKANLPFSDFTLTGVSSPERLQKYLKSVENIYITKQLPSIAVDYQAIGAYLGSLNLDEHEGIFTSLMSHDLDQCKFQWLPFAGSDPVIDIQFGNDFKKMMSSKDPRLKRMISLLPAYIQVGLKKGAVELEPGSTLYVPRRGLSSDYKGQSVFKRVLTIHLVEKALIKGTIEQSMRRQRPILHITAGSDSWEPTQQELSNIANLFRDADMDPINATVVTRQDISSQDVKDHSSMWKWEDMFEFASSAKMRALGINESFLSGDASYNCLVGDTLLHTEKGLIRIKDLVDTPNRQETINIKMMGRFNKPEVAVKWLNNGVAPTIKVETSIGSEIIGTPKHPVLVYRNGICDWVKLSDLKKTDLICMSSKPYIKKEKLKLSFEKTENTFDTLGRVKGCKKVNCKIPTYMNPKLAFLVGMFISEGHYNGTEICITNSNKKIISLCCNYIKELFNINPNVVKIGNKGDYIESLGCTRNVDVYQIKISRCYVSEFFEYLGCSRVTATYKRVPWSILQADTESQRSYVAAYIEGDGCISKEYQISVASYSLNNLKDLQVLLMFNGIFGSIGKRKNALWFFGRQKDLLWSFVEPYMISKKLTQKSDYSNDTTGIPSDFVKTYLDSVCLGRNKGRGYLYKTDKGIKEFTNFFTPKVFSYVKYKNGYYNNYLNNLKKISDSLYRQLVYLLKLEYKLVSIKSIRKNGNKPVYDISMKKGVEPAFVANGMIVHNTMETALSVFLEDLRAMRDYMTAEIFYDKMFPAIAVVNDFKTTKERFSVTSSLGASNCFMGQRNSGIFKNNKGEYVALAGGGLHHSIYEIEDITKYEIPTIHWHKELKPEADKDYMEILTSLQEQGLPIPLRMWAAAGGVSMDELMSDVEEDKKIRNKIAQLTGVPQAGDMTGMEDMMNSEFSNVRQLKDMVVGTLQNRVGKRPLLAREYGDQLAPGKINNQNILVPASKRQQNIINEKINKLCSSVLADLAKRNNYEAKKEYEQLKEKQTRRIY